MSARAPLLARLRDRDRGSASVWLLGVGLVLLTAGLGGTAVGAAHVARHQAQAAADLGALAGAARAVEGQTAACARAGELAAANGARMTGCELAGLDLIVTVEVSPAAVVGIGRVATATARAGPVRADDYQGTTGRPTATAIAGRPPRRRQNPPSPRCPWGCGETLSVTCFFVQAAGPWSRLSRAEVSRLICCSFGGEIYQSEPRYALVSLWPLRPATGEVPT